MKGSEEASRFPPGSLVCLKTRSKGQTQVLHLHEERNEDNAVAQATYTSVGMHTTLVCIVIAVLEKPEIVGRFREKHGVWALLQIVSIRREDGTSKQSEAFHRNDLVMVPTCPFGHTYTFMTEP